MEQSNQFPIKGTKEKDTQMPTNEKARFIFFGIKENCPNLYKYIKAVKS